MLTKLLVLSVIYRHMEQFQLLHEAVILQVRSSMFIDSARLLTVVVLGLAMLAGCGGGVSDEVPRVDISGSATFDGQPIASGEVTFIPDSSKGNSGPATNAPIKDGAYTTVGHGKGMVGGPHILRITAFDGKADIANELPNGEPLFPDYQMPADLPKAEGAKEPLKFDIAVPKEAKDPPKVKRTNEIAA